VRIRRSTGPGASPLPDQNENRNEQTRTCSRWIRVIAPVQGVCERCVAASTLVFVVSITLVTFDGDR
jgi:hypothetical protein